MFTATIAPVIANALNPSPAPNLILFCWMELLLVLEGHGFFGGLRI